MKASDKYPTPPTVGASVIVPVDTFEAMKRELDHPTPKGPEKVWPQEGRAYHYWDQDGDGQSTTYDRHRFDDYRISTGNCHQAIEEAEAYKAWLTSPITQARRRIEGLDGFNPGGAIVVRYGEATRTVSYIERDNSYIHGGIAFDAPGHAEAALSTHGADIRLVLTGES